MVGGTWATGEPHHISPLKIADLMEVLSPELLFVYTFDLRMLTALFS